MRVARFSVLPMLNSSGIDDALLFWRWNEDRAVLDAVAAWSDDYAVWARLPSDRDWRTRSGPPPGSETVRSPLRRWYGPSSPGRVRGHQPARPATSSGSGLISRAPMMRTVDDAIHALRKRGFLTAKGPGDGLAPYTLVFTFAWEAPFMDAVHLRAEHDATATRARIDHQSSLTCLFADETTTIPHQVRSGGRASLLMWCRNCSRCLHPASRPRWL